MTDKEQKKKVHPSYKAMLDAVEEFVKKENKNFKEAFLAAEKKLEIASEHSKENIRKASESLKLSLAAFGEAIEGASEAYKEQLKFDISYANTSAWEQLKSLANSNTAELIVFTRTLREVTNDVANEEHLSAHKQHGLWDSEHGLWLDEIECWLKEHKQALEKLEEIELAVLNHTAELLRHKNAIEAHIDIEKEHEKVMRHVEQDPTSQMYQDREEKVKKTHLKEKEMHAEQSQVHQTLKAQHLKTISMINMLHKEVK